MNAHDQSTTPESPKKPEPPAGEAGTLQVSPEEAHRLAECCAFFKAEHFREAQPGALRESDVDIVQEQIEEIVAHYRRA